MSVGGGGGDDVTRSARSQPVSHPVTLQSKHMGRSSERERDIGEVKRQICKRSFVYAPESSLARSLARSPSKHNLHYITRREKKPLELSFEGGTNAQIALIAAARSLRPPLGVLSQFGWNSSRHHSSSSRVDFERPGDFCARGEGVSGWVGPKGSCSDVNKAGACDSLKESNRAVLSTLVVCV